MKTFIENTLAPTSGVNPLVYILLVVSFIIGLCFTPIVGLEPSESILYGVTFLFSKGLWGGLLVLSSVVSIVGLAFQKEGVFFIGGMMGFLLWLFACISLFLAGQWYVLMTVGVLHLLFHGYIYLGASTGLIFGR